MSSLPFLQTAPKLLLRSSQRCLATKASLNHYPSPFHLFSFDFFLLPHYPPNKPQDGPTTRCPTPGSKSTCAALDQEPTSEPTESNTTARATPNSSSSRRAGIHSNHRCASKHGSVCFGRAIRFRSSPKRYTCAGSTSSSELPLRLNTVASTRPPTFWDFLHQIPAK